MGWRSRRLAALYNCAILVPNRAPSFLAVRGRNVLCCCNGCVASNEHGGVGFDGVVMRETIIGDAHRPIVSERVVFSTGKMWGTLSKPGRGGSKYSTCKRHSATAIACGYMLGLEILRFETDSPMVRK